jgi:hypothetical protein
MAILNITYDGLSADCRLALDAELTDADVKRVAAELVRSGQVPGLHLPALPAGAFEHFVVDRLPSAAGELRLYLRPKVPFGAEAGA